MAVALLCACASHGLRIRTAHGNEAERAAARQIEAALARQDVARWIYRREVVIGQGAIPHGHPVLTLNARPGADDAKLATFVHEQFHRYVDARRASARLRWPDSRACSRTRPPAVRRRPRPPEYVSAPDRLRPGVAGLAELLGEERAREVLAGNRHYTWIYEQVLGDPRIRRVNARHGAAAA